MSLFVALLAGACRRAGFPARVKGSRCATPPSFDRLSRVGSLLSPPAADEQPDGRVPVWFMRQAGRSLPEYREPSATASACWTAAAGPTWSPRSPCSRSAATASTRRSSTPTSWCRCKAAGVDLDIVSGQGPVIAHPVRRLADLEQIRPLEPGDLWYVTEAVELLVAELGPTPLIGFAGAPFTLASYLVEGGPSKDYARTKAMMVSEPELWHGLCSRLAELSATFLRTQVAAGAAAVQLFDSWAGSLSAADYARYAQPYSAQVLGRPGRDRRAADPLRRGHRRSCSGLMGEAGAEVVGVDWRVPLAEASRRIGPAYAVQGNLDPALLVAPRGRCWPSGSAQVVRSGAAAPGHIFNLGHGVPPETDPDVLARIVDLVHTEGPELAGRGAAERLAAGVAMTQSPSSAAGSPGWRRPGALALAGLRGRGAGAGPPLGRQARAARARTASGWTAGRSRCWPGGRRRTALVADLGLGASAGAPDRRPARRCWSAVRCTRCRPRCWGCPTDVDALRGLLSRTGLPARRRRARPPGTAARSRRGHRGGGRRAVRPGGDRPAAGAPARRGVRRARPRRCPSPPSAPDLFARARAGGSLLRARPGGGPAGSTGAGLRRPGRRAVRRWSTALVADLERCGVELRPGTTVRALDRTGGRFRLTAGPAPAPGDDRRRRGRCWPCPADRPAGCWPELAGTAPELAGGAVRLGRRGHPGGARAGGARLRDPGAARASCRRSRR